MSTPSTSAEALAARIPSAWRALLSGAVANEAFEKLSVFLKAARRSGEVYPPEELVFAALEKTPPERVKVVLLGQDPYHGEGQATGLSFSIPVGAKVPSSLRNMYKELKADLGLDIPNHGNLEAWAAQGVLMLNSVLTVEKSNAGSHRKKGWEDFTSAVLRAVNAQEQRVVFLLLGNDAKKKGVLVDEDKHVIVSAAHPSGLSAHRGFFESRVYSKVNAALVAGGRGPIDWLVPDHD